MRDCAERRNAEDRQVGTQRQSLHDAACDPHDEWQTLWLTAPSLSIRGGTDEIQRNIVGERVLGLPGEPRVDRELPFDRLPS